jgi:serine/threonine protein kinase
MPSVQMGSQPDVGELQAALPVGHELTRYRVERVLGRGGMATVYLVRHTTLGTLHALKVLDLASKLVRERLLLEGRVQARLRHPNLVSVTDVLDVHGAPGLLMEYVDGPSLDAWIHGNKPDLQTSSQMFCGILSAMEQAHALGYVHRDLKPANVLLARDIGRWVPKVTDFGIAKVLHRESQGMQTHAGLPMGTPSFMAPEQVKQAHNVDARADIFSLGCILYQLVTHELAFPGDNMLEIFNAASEGRYRDPRELVPGLPEALGQGLRGALAADPEARITDCGTLRRVLSGQQPWGAETTSPPNFQLPACALPAAVLEEDPTTPDLEIPAVPASLDEPLFVPSQASVGPEGPWVNGPTLTMEAFEAAEAMQKGRVRRAAIISALASAAAMGLIWLFVGNIGETPNVGEEFISSRTSPTQIESPAPATPEPTLTAVALEIPEPEPEPTPATNTNTNTNTNTTTTNDPTTPRAPRTRTTTTNEPTTNEPTTHVSTTPRAPRTRTTTPPAPTTGTIQVLGDHAAAQLIDPSGRAHPPGDLPTGAYDLKVRFPSGRSIDLAGFVVVEAGQTRTLRCSALMENCR